MTIAIMQPSFLPWPGFFNLIANAQVFVFLDDVKVEKGSWHTRNQILQNGKAQYITVPITGSRNQLLMNTQCNDTANWRAKHSRTLEQSYSKHPSGKAMLDCVLPVINTPALKGLAALNMALIIALCSKLELPTKFEISSSFGIDAVRSERLLAICRRFEQTRYLSPVGARDYIESDAVLAEAGVDVCYQSWVQQDYAQRGIANFVPYMSIIDMIANIGWEGASARVRAG